MPHLKPFYIIGCQRSGTTLMRLILDSHPQVSCVDESSAYDLLLDHHLLPHEEVDANGGAIGGTDARRPISSVHVGQFTKQLTPEEVEVVWEVAGETMLKFGYAKEVN